MSDPTIRISTCRGDGRCPECGEGSAFPFRLLCGCSPCLSSACSLNHTRALLTEALRQRDYGPRIVATVAKDEIAKLREERDAAIRQVEEQRHPCPCGKDTASIKWARCYSCRQAYHAEMERAMAERDSAIRERDEARAQLVDLAHGYALDITASRALGKLTLERADRAEALLRAALAQLEIAFRDWMGHIPVGWLRKTSALDRARELDALLGKIREALA